jgi:metallo-beta-lactamase class B
VRHATRSAALLALLALCGAGCAGSPGPTAAADTSDSDSGWEMPASWTAVQEPVHLGTLRGDAELYYVGSQDLAAYLVTTPQGHILIDAPLEENVDRMWSHVEALGHDPKDIEVLLASHAHFDHVGGMAEVKRRTGAKLLVADADATQMARGGLGDFFLEDRGPFEAVEADGPIVDGQVVRLGGAELTALVTPGHTRGCTSWKMELADGDETHTAVVICSLSVLDGMRLWKDPHYDGLGKDFCASVAKLEAVDADVFLASHASFFDLRQKAGRLDENPDAFVDPEGYRRYLAGARQKIEDTLEAEGLAEGCAGL